MGFVKCVVAPPPPSRFVKEQKREEICIFLSLIMPLTGGPFTFILHRLTLGKLLYKKYFPYHSVLMWATWGQYPLVWDIWFQKQLCI